MDGAFLHSIWTVLLLLVFLGIVYWAFIHKRPSDFDKAARMPLEDETEKSGDDPETGKGSRKKGKDRGHG